MKKQIIFTDWDKVFQDEKSRIIRLMTIQAINEIPKGNIKVRTVFPQPML